ncbi:MAG: hypothetical protein ACYDA1_05865 [Vulcanimicrobiaceae bacterium]
MKITVALTSFLFLLLVGCGGARIANPPSSNCTPSAYLLTLTTPANGATGVTTGGETMVFTLANIPSGFGTVPAQLPAVSITASNGTVLSSGTLSSSGSTYTATLPALASATTYSVTQSITPTASGCPSSLIIGSFTTQ